MLNNLLVNQGSVVGNNRSFVDVLTYIGELKLERRYAVDRPRSIDRPVGISNW